MSRRVLIYGVPGTGKSTVAEMLAGSLGYKYIELDGIRSKAKKLVSQPHDPFLYEYTTRAWRQFGEFSKPNVVSGFLAVRDAMTKYVADELARQVDGYIAEAVFIDPKLSDSTNATALLITVANKHQHYAQFFTHRNKSSESGQQFEAARYIQDFLIEEARKLNISTFNNTDTPSVTVRQIQDLLKAT